MAAKQIAFDQEARENIKKLLLPVSANSNGIVSTEIPTQKYVADRSLIY